MYTCTHRDRSPPTYLPTYLQVGWVIGPQELLADIQTALPYVQFCASTPMQEALTSVIRRAGERPTYLPTYLASYSSSFSSLEPPQPRPFHTYLPTYLPAELPYEGAPTYYHWLASQFRAKRDKLAAALKEAGIIPQQSQVGR